MANSWKGTLGFLGLACLAAANGGASLADPPVREEHRLEAGPDKVGAVAISGDGAIVAALGRRSASGGPVSVWRVSTGSPERLRGAFETSARAVALSRDGTLLATAGDDHVALWRLPDGQQVGSVEARRAGQVAFSPSGTLLAITRLGNPFLWDVKDRRIKAVLAPGGGVEAIAFSPNGGLVATASDDGSVVLWNLDGTERARFKMAENLGDHVAVAPDDKLVAALSLGGTQPALIWDRGSGRVRTADTGVRDEGVFSVAFAPSGNLVAGHASGIITVTDPATMRLLARLEGHAQPVAALALSADGRRLASGSWDGTVRLWRAGGTMAAGTVRAGTAAGAAPPTRARAPVRVGDAVPIPRIRHQAQPDYPEGAKKAGAAGVVILDVTLAPEGHVTEAKVIRGVHPELDRAAVEAVKQWLYEPARLDGVAVPVIMTVTVRFARE
jgi:TonB family protein